MSFSLPAAAFHDGGVAACSSCHVVHDTPLGPMPSPTLLLASNSTDLCLLCHETTSGNTWGQTPIAPGPVYGGGSFVFLLEENLNDGPGGADPANWIPGSQAGHNVISMDKGTLADPFYSVSPGGSFPSSAMSCTACHDPHGRGGHFRLLYGSDYPDANPMGTPFTYTNPAPQATGIALSGAPESKTNHTAYRSGMSDWCANCHGQWHDNGGSPLDHPSGEPLEPAIVSTYNTYQGTGFLTGTGTDAYEPLVPFEDLSMTTGYQGPAGGASRVMCLTCHRAHASSGPRSGRWDFEITTWADEGVVSLSYPIPNPYAGTSGLSQGQLCEKCHGSSLP